MLSVPHKHKMVAALRQRLCLDQPPGGAAVSRPLIASTPDLELFAGGLHEVVSDTGADHAAALAFALIAARQGQRVEGALFFAALASQSQDNGELYGHGLAQLGLAAEQVILLSAPSEKALLWAAEEAASCPALGAAVIALGAREKLYGFTASRRLKLRQEKSGVPLFIVRRMAGEPTAATARWRIASAPSQGVSVPGASAPLLGAPRFRLWLERYAGQPPQEWEIDYDAAHRLRVAAPLSDRPLDARRGRGRRAA
jgi:protein ImuA